MDIKEILSNGDDGKWYRIPDSNARLKIRSLTPKERRTVLRQCTSQRLIQNRWREETDWERLNSLMLDLVVVDWDEIQESGQKLPVTTENKTKLDENWPSFANLWNAVVARSSNMEDAVAEAELGNS